MNAAYRTTAADLAAALVAVAKPATDVKWVEDEATGARVGYLRERGGEIEWNCYGRSGYAKTVAQTLVAMAPVVLQHREDEAADAVARAAVEALPEPLRSLHILVSRASIEVAREEHRNIINDDRLAEAREKLARAEAAYAAAERMARAA